MPTQITQFDDADRGRTVLRVGGQMLREDADVLCRIAHDLAGDTGRGITIDVADLDFIDSEAATLLKGLQNSAQVELTGFEILLQNAINEAERQS